MKLECTHVDTCLPDYVLDHCNGDNEMLIGCQVDGRTRNGELRAELKREVRAYGDKLPDSISESEVNAAIDECFSGADGRRSFDSSLEKAPDESGESCYAWFRFTWESAQ